MPNNTPTIGLALENLEFDYLYMAMFKPFLITAIG